MLHSFVQTRGVPVRDDGSRVGRKAGKTATLSRAGRAHLRALIEKHSSVRSVALKVDIAPTSLGRFLDGETKGISAGVLDLVMEEIGADLDDLLTEQRDGDRLLALYGELLVRDPQAARDVVGYVRGVLNQARKQRPLDSRLPSSSAATASEKPTR